MKRGLILGKFMPLHAGHLALINFGSKQCDELLVLICATKEEPISGEIRLKWLIDTLLANDKIKIQLLYYDESILPNTSESSERVSQIWADYLSQHFPGINIIFASEPYGKYLAHYLNCEYALYDIRRTIVPISASMIRQAPFEHWDCLPEKVRPYYVKKICLYGTESTGKTTMTEKLASYFNTSFVTEMARFVLENTVECNEHHLTRIAELHAKTIIDSMINANKLLFVDTDINITRSYSRFLFNKEMQVPAWIEDVNQFDLHLFMDKDADYVQDGTRLDKTERDKLDEYHKQELEIRGIPYVLLQGNWEEKFTNAVSIIKKRFDIYT